MMRILPGILVLVGWLNSHLPAARSAPPTLPYLFPAGTQRGQSVEVTAGGTFERWPVGAWTDATAITVKAAKDKGKLSITVAPDAVPGLCWIRLHDAEGASSLRPFLVGTLPEVAEKEPNDDPKKPQQLPASTMVVNGRLAQPGDVDTFALKLTRGQTLVASLEANRTLASPLDGILQVVSADGFVLEQNNDCHNLDPQLTFTAPADGTYAIRVFAFPAMPDSSIRFAGGETYVYRLTLTTGSFVEYAFPLAVSRANPVPVELIGWNIPAATRRLPVRPQDGHTTFRATLADAAGFFDVPLEPHPILIKENADKPVQLPIPATVSGRILADGEVHRYRFDARKGQKVSFRVESRALGLPLDPVLQITDSAGKSLALQDDAGGRTGSRDPELLFTVPQDGQYSLEVRDLHGASGPLFAYRLRAVHPEPNVRLTAAADRFTLVPGKDLDIPLTIERTNGFNEAIEIVPLGLPPGITATPLTLAAAGTAGKGATFRLSAAPGAKSGPFQILGRIPGRPEKVHLVHSAVVELKEVIPHFWLTVLDAKAQRPE